MRNGEVEDTGVRKAITGKNCTIFQWAEVVYRPVINHLLQTAGCRFAEIACR